MWSLCSLLCTQTCAVVWLVCECKIPSLFMHISFCVDYMWYDRLCVLVWSWSLSRAGMRYSTPDSIEYCMFIFFSSPNAGRKGKCTTGARFTFRKMRPPRSCPSPPQSLHIVDDHHEMPVLSMNHTPMKQQLRCSQVITLIFKGYIL